MIEMGKGRKQMPAEFGKLIRRLREEKGYSLEQLSKKVDVSASYVHRIETGEKKRPSFVIIEEIAEALDVDVFDLLQISNSGQEHTTKTLAELLYGHSSVTTGGVTLHADAKEALLNVIDEIIKAKWSHSTMISDINNISTAISKFKEVF